MKIVKSIVLITVVALFAAGCADGGGFSFDPGQGMDPPTWDPPVWDPPVDLPPDGDPPADDNDDPIVYRPIEPPTYSIDIPSYRRADQDADGAVDIGVIDIRSVDCDNFDIDSARNVCKHLACEGSENFGECFQAEAHSIECEDVYDWVSDVPESCEIFYLKEDLCLSDRCREQAQSEQRDCEKKRDAFGDIVTNSGCYPDFGAVSDMMDKTAQTAAKIRDSIRGL